MTKKYTALFLSRFVVLPVINLPIPFTYFELSFSQPGHTFGNIDNFITRLL